MFGGRRLTREVRLNVEKGQREPVAEVTAAGKGRGTEGIRGKHGDHVRERSKEVD